MRKLVERVRNYVVRLLYLFGHADRPLESRLLHYEILYVTSGCRDGIVWFENMEGRADLIRSWGGAFVGQVNRPGFYRVRRRKRTRSWTLSVMTPGDVFTALVKLERTQAKTTYQTPAEIPDLILEVDGDKVLYLTTNHQADWLQSVIDMDYADILDGVKGPRVNAMAILVLSRPHPFWFALEGNQQMDGIDWRPVIAAMKTHAQKWASVVE